MKEKKVIRYSTFVILGSPQCKNAVIMVDAGKPVIEKREFSRSNTNLFEGFRKFLQVDSQFDTIELISQSLSQIKF
jgi:hypothetical protein